MFLESSARYAICYALELNIHSLQSIGADFSSPLTNFRRFQQFAGMMGDEEELERKKAFGKLKQNCMTYRVGLVVISYRSVLRCVKLWAKKRGVYRFLLGFFGGVHLAVLSAFICHRHSTASLSLPCRPYEFCHSNVVRSTF
ncbi:hypothetical protein K7X08_012120 [Anisodus acutangulus]|uniref:polynucleotide adenylyltransferase n=1 Tax=Anisodus acutangulus TaxID=402998 RepID=A0A9Q1LAS2_9SOLA|nr:hypothetical protein K7X08_012120 [Anisodus acutangulus]